MTNLVYIVLFQEIKIELYKHTYKWPQGQRYIRSIQKSNILIIILGNIPGVSAKKFIIMSMVQCHRIFLYLQQRHDI